MEKVQSPKLYWTNCLWMMGLLFNLVIALTIAFTKMILIALFFMHLKGSSRVLHLAAITGLLWLFLMLLLTLSDYYSRG